MNQTTQAGMPSNNAVPSDDRALASISTQFFVNGAVVASYVPRLPGIRDDFGASLTTIGVVLALASGMGVLGSLAVGPVLERVATKRIMTVGSILLVLALPLISVVQAPWQLLIVASAISVLDVLVDVSMNVQGSLISGRRPRPVMNRLHGMWSLGTVVGGLLAATMEAADVPLGAHLAGVALVLTLSLLFVVPGLLPFDDRDDQTGGVPSGTAGRLALLFVVIGAAAILPEMITSDWSAFRLTDDLAASGGLAGLSYVSFTSGMVTGRFTGDAVLVRLGSGRLLQWATATAAIGLLTATLVPAVPAVFIGLFVAGLGVSVMFPQLYDGAARAERPGAALGGLTAGTRIALFIAPAIVGAIADLDAVNVGTAMAIVTLPATLAVLVLSRRVAPPREAAAR